MHRPATVNARGLIPVILVLFGIAILASAAQGVDPRSELRILADEVEGGALSDQEMVQKIGARLDSLKGKTDLSSIHEKGVLIGLSTFIPYHKDSSVVELARNKRREVLEIYTSTPFKADLDGRELLYFAAGSVGAPMDQKAVLDYAKNAGNPLALRLRALNAIAGQDHFIPNLEEELAPLTRDELHFSADSDVGPRTGRLFYPIRDGAENILTKYKGVPRDKADVKRPPKHDSAKIQNQNPTDAASTRATRTIPQPKSNIGVSDIPRAGWIAWIAIAAALLWMFIRMRGTR